jgi:uncharacterized paraquat-inducible protein A
MPKKKSKITPKKIMDKIKLDKIRIRPRWYFVVGSGLLLVGLVLLGVGVMFLINLMFFSLRAQGPMADRRVAMMLFHFPWWLLVLSVLGVLVGVKLLKKYDFSYKKNFNLVVVILVLTMLVAGVLFDRMGLNEKIIKNRLGIRLYQGLERGRMYR